MARSRVTYRAYGNLNPSRFFMAYLTGSPNNVGAAFGVVQADGTQPIMGISQEGTDGAPGTPFNTGYAAVSGEYFTQYSDPDEDVPLLLLGAAVTAGQFLVSDASGQGVPWDPAMGAKQYVGAQALRTQATATLCPVKPYFDILPKSA